MMFDSLQRKTAPAYQHDLFQLEAPLSLARDRPVGGPEQNPQDGVSS